MTAPFPPRDDLLLTVRDFLLELRPTLDPERRYRAQVAAYLLDIVRREGERPGVTDHAALERFRADMRRGALDGDEAALAEQLLEAAIAEVRIVRPDYLDPAHRGDIA